MGDDDLLRRSQELLAKLFRNSPAAIGLVRLRDGVMLDVNQAYERLYGWPREEIVGRSTEELRIWVDPEERERFRALIAEKGRVMDFVSRARRRNGEIFDSQLSSEVIEESGERILLVIAVDVTERRHAEDALRQSEQRYRTLAATMVEGILILQDGRFAYANPGALELIGHPFAELQGREFGPFIHPEDRELVRERHRRRAAGEALEPRYDIRILPRSGEPRWVQIANERVDWEGQPAVLTLISDISERKAAEQALRASEERFAKLFREAPEAMTLVRAADGAFLDVNQEWERRTGYARQEAVGRTSLELALWPQAQERESMLHVMRAARSVRDHEFALRRRDGATRRTLLDGVAVEIAGETCWLFTLRDITERRRADEMQAQLAAVVETSSDAIILSDPELRIVSWNAAAQRMFGWSAAEAVGQPVTLIVPAERQRETLRNTGQLKQGEAPPAFETVRKARDGRLLDVQISLSGVYDAEGRLQLVAGIFRDITERKRAEAALRENEQRFRALVELSSDWYWVTDSEHRFTFREGEILRRMGIPPEEDYGQRRWEMGFLNMDEAAWVEHRALLERREEFRELLLERRSADGRVHWATISGRPLVDAQGRFAGYHGTGRDVTRQMAAEQELRKFNVALERKVMERTEALNAANRELEAFTYSASHDLRAPLRAIDGFADLLAERLAGALTGEAREYLGQLHAAAARMNRLIDDLLALSQASRAALAKSPVDLSALARVVARDIGARGGERRVAWRIADGLGALADPGLMRIMLENLLGNAWKYTGRKEEAVIEVGANAAGEIFVRDNGIGFDPAQAVALFEPFRRLEGAQHFEGTGIGLATVQRIVERHGGRVRAEGAAGEGAAFYVWLPPERRRSSR
jgi:PAS domain S-box-containing protein